MKTPEKTRREYKNPPVKELVIGIYFAKPFLKLRAEHVGLFWKTVEKDLPLIEQQPPIKELYIPAPNEQFPLPRYWLKGSDDTFLLQIQRNALLFNWRKRDTGDYPHFAAVKEGFDKYYLQFAEFVRSEVKEEDLTIEICELTYVNTIESGEHWNGLEDIDSVIPSYKPLDTGIVDATLSNFRAVNVLQVADDLTLTVSLRNGLRPDGKAPVLWFENRLSGKIAEGTKVAADAWFERAHDLSGICFNGLTSEKFQKDVWQFKEGSKDIG